MIILSGFINTFMEHFHFNYIIVCFIVNIETFISSFGLFSGCFLNSCMYSVHFPTRPERGRKRERRNKGGRESIFHKYAKLVEVTKDQALFYSFRREMFFSHLLMRGNLLLVKGSTVL